MSMLDQERKAVRLKMSFKKHEKQKTLPSERLILEYKCIGNFKFFVLIVNIKLELGMSYIYITLSSCFSKTSVFFTTLFTQNQPENTAMTSP